MFAVSRSVLLGVSLSVLGGVLVAQEGVKPPAPTKTEKRHEGQGDAKRETWAVVEVGDRLTAVSDAAVVAMRKEKRAAYDAAMQEFEHAKAAAEASKAKFDRKPPQEEKVVVKKTGLASMADAEQAIAALQAARADQHAKKAEKATKKADQHDADGGHGAKPKA